ncbi:MAG: NERD domain-containing protein [Fibromonadaceae bacterium]|jgi:RNA processing factor Prp31|nr:NERD domain-containing protein [Fibromonadaceae bacterium]
MKKKELTAADVWAMLAKTDRILTEKFAKTERILNEKFAETDRQMKETALQMKETDRQVKETALQMKETDKKLEKLGIKVGGIDDNIGHHAEQYFQDILAETLTFGDIKYDEMIPNIAYRGKKGEIEFDIALVNGKSIAIIEVKNRIHPNDVRKFAEERIEKFRIFFPEFKRHKAYLGIAGFSFSKAVLEEAKKYGMGVIKQVGKGLEIKANNLRAY